MSAFMRRREGEVLIAYFCLYSWFCTRRRLSDVFARVNMCPRDLSVSGPFHSLLCPSRDTRSVSGRLLMLTFFFLNIFGFWFLVFGWMAAPCNLCSKANLIPMQDSESFITQFWQQPWWHLIQLHLIMRLRWARNTNWLWSMSYEVWFCSTGWF